MSLWDLARRVSAEVRRWPEWKKRAADQALVSQPPPEVRAQARRVAYVTPVSAADLEGELWQAHARDVGVTDRELLDVILAAQVLAVDPLYAVRDLLRRTE